MSFPQMFDDPYGAAYGVGKSDSKFSGIGQYSGGTTSNATPAGKTWFSDILNQSLPSTDRPHMNSYTTRSGYGSSTGRDSSIPYGSMTSWQPAAGSKMPTMGEIPTYLIPKVDQGRISELTELDMGAPMSRLRRGLNQALVESRYSDNPNVRALSRGKALSGYGSGISDIRSGAHSTAMSQYAPEFQAKVAKSQSEYQAKVQRLRDQLNADMQKYMKSGSQVTTPVQGRYEGSTAKKISWDQPKAPTAFDRFR